MEITGPVDQKMTINALNSGAKVWLADMEDSSTPTWRNIIKGQLNLTDALERRIDFTSPEGKEYKLRPAGELPTIVVRPAAGTSPRAHAHRRRPCGRRHRGLRPVLLPQRRRLLAQGKGPYFYLPKIENHLEARLWNDIFILAQDLLGIPQGTIRATVLIETITAAFEMEEILYELRDHAAGLNAGRWDYIFSLIKNFRTRGPRFVLPDRAQVTMTQPFMRAYTEQLVRACHKRGAWPSVGWPPPFPTARTKQPTPTPSRRSVPTRPARPTTASTVPGWPTRTSCPSAAKCSTPSSARSPTSWTAPARTSPPMTAPSSTWPPRQAPSPSRASGTTSKWASGTSNPGCVETAPSPSTTSWKTPPPRNISRSQLWQWMFASAITDHGEIITHHWIEELADEEFARLECFDGDRFEDARDIFEEVTLSQDFPSFLTLPAYARYLTEAREKATQEELAAA